MQNSECRVTQVMGRFGTVSRSEFEPRFPRVACEQDLVHDIVDVRATTHLMVNEVDPFADAGEAGSEHLVTLGRQQSADRAPTVGRSSRHAPTRRLP